MARKSKWSTEDRKKILKMVSNGITEQDIREELAINGKAMTAIEFAQQFKMAMVEDGQIKQASTKKKVEKAKIYEVTDTGRLSITDFAEMTGATTGAKFKLEKPRGRSKAWRLVPAE